MGAILLGLKTHGLALFYYFPLLPTTPEDAPMRLGVILIIVIGCLLGMILSVIGAAFPAWRAAQLPPAEAMRTEV